MSLEVQPQKVFYRSVCVEKSPPYPKKCNQLRAVASFFPRREMHLGIKKAFVGKDGCKASDCVHFAKKKDVHVGKGKLSVPKRCGLKEILCYSYWQLMIASAMLWNLASTLSPRDGRTTGEIVPWSVPATRAPAKRGKAL